MKESKINNETPEKIISAAIYTLCSCGPRSGLEGITKIPQPGIRFPGWVTFPTLCACKAELELDTSDSLCLHRMFACHTQPSSGWDSRHPNSFVPKRDDSQELLCRKCLRAPSRWQSWTPTRILGAFPLRGRGNNAGNFSPGKRGGLGWAKERWGLFITLCAPNSQRYCRVGESSFSCLNLAK